MADGNTFVHPAVERMALRRQMMAAVETMLQAVDLLIAELDSDAPDPDREPSLGAPEHPDHLWAVPASYFVWAQGASDGRELEETDQDFGGLGDRTNQARWGAVGGPEGDDEPDLEPSLGASLDTHGNADQAVTWASDGARSQFVAKVEVDDAEHDGSELPEDNEPDLGSLDHEADQSTWCAAPSERQGWSVMDGEPSMASLEQMDQRRWGDGARDEREETAPEIGAAMFDAPANENRP